MVTPKKHLGQHFLTDKNIARKIAGSLDDSLGSHLLEIGAGTGILTEFLMEKPQQFFVIEIDKESVAHLQQRFPELQHQIIEGDFLKLDFRRFHNEPLSIIGNFPYNISSQIFFAVLKHRRQVRQVVGMVQKEVAERITAIPGSKTYGILSVLLQAFYSASYLFTVGEQVFQPPPKVKSAVIRLVRNSTDQLPCNESLFFDVVKTAFNQRRKMLRNSLKKFNLDAIPDKTILTQRPEQLAVQQFVELTQWVEKADN